MKFGLILTVLIWSIKQINQTKDIKGAQKHQRKNKIKRRVGNNWRKREKSAGGITAQKNNCAKNLQDGKRDRKKAKSLYEETQWKSEETKRLKNSQIRHQLKRKQSDWSGTKVTAQSQNNSNAPILRQNLTFVWKTHTQTHTNGKEKNTWQTRPFSEISARKI